MSALIRFRFFWFKQHLLVLETLVPTLGRRLLEKGIRLQDLAGPRARRSFFRPGQSGVGTQPCQRNPQGWLGNMGTLGINHPILGVSNFDPFPHDTHMMQHIQPDDSFWQIFPQQFPLIGP